MKEHIQKTSSHETPSHGPEELRKIFETAFDLPQTLKTITPSKTDRTTDTRLTFIKQALEKARNRENEPWKGINTETILATIATLDFRTEAKISDDGTVRIEEPSYHSSRRPKKHVPPHDCVLVFKPNKENKKTEITVQYEFEGRDRGITIDYMAIAHLLSHVFETHVGISQKTIKYIADSLGGPDAKHYYAFSGTPSKNELLPFLKACEAFLYLKTEIEKEIEQSIQTYKHYDKKTGEGSYAIEGESLSSRVEDIVFQNVSKWLQEHLDEADLVTDANAFIENNTIQVVVEREVAYESFWGAERKKKREIINTHTLPPNTLPITSISSFSLPKDGETITIPLSEEYAVPYGFYFYPWREERLSENRILHTEMIRRIFNHVSDLLSAVEKKRVEEKTRPLRSIHSDADALTILGLSQDELTLPRLKERFRELVKLHHPDLQPQGSKEKKLAEVEMKEINIAYKLLGTLFE